MNKQHVHRPGFVPLRDFDLSSNVLSIGKDKIREVLTPAFLARMKAHTIETPGAVNWPERIRDVSAWDVLKWSIRNRWLQNEKGYWPDDTSFVVRVKDLEALIFDAFNLFVLRRNGKIQSGDLLIYAACLQRWKREGLQVVEVRGLPGIRVLAHPRLRPVTDWERAAAFVAEATPVQITCTPLTGAAAGRVPITPPTV